MKEHELPKNYVPKNSSMARNEKEVDNLGKQMEHRRTEEVLNEEYDKKQDPVQYDNDEK